MANHSRFQSTSGSRLLYLAGLVVVCVGTTMSVVVGAIATMLALTFPDVDAGTSAPDWGAGVWWGLVTALCGLGGGFAFIRCLRGFRAERHQLN